MLLRGFDTELLEESGDTLLSLGEVDTELLEESGDTLLSLGEVGTKLPSIEGGNFLLVEAMLLERNTM